MKGIRAALVILGILIGVDSSGQENFVPGKIITLQGDTLDGYIDYRNWGINPDNIFWETSPEEERQRATSLDILGFIVHDEMYLSAVVKRETSPLSLSDLDSDPGLNLDVDTVFLQTMVQGSKSLYYYRDLNSKDHFYIRQDTSFDLLIYKKYYTLYRGAEYPAENEKYLGQLTFYLNDCPSIQAKIQKTKYSRLSLENLFQYYYECIDSDAEFLKKTERSSLETGVLAGLSLTSLNFRGSNAHYLVSTDFSLSVNFSGGFFLNVVLPRHQRKWSINNELIYTSYYVEGTYTDVVDAAEYRVTDNEIGFGYLKMNNMVRFRYPIRNADIFANLGISTGVALYEINERTMETHIYTSTRIEEGKAIDDTRRIEEAVNIGAGARYKRFSLEMRYELGNGNMEPSNTKSSTNRWYFLLGYTF